MNIHDTRPACADAALACAARGWHVFPVPPGSKKSHKAAEHGGGRATGATTDPDAIDRDGRRWPQANVGIVTGAAFAVDDLQHLLDAVRDRARPAERRPDGYVHFSDACRRASGVALVQWQRDGTLRNTLRVGPQWRPDNLGFDLAELQERVRASNAELPIMLSGVARRLRVDRSALVWLASAEHIPPACVLRRRGTEPVAPDAFASRRPSLPGSRPNTSALPSSPTNAASPGKTSGGTLMPTVSDPSDTLTARRSSFSGAATLGG